MKQRVSLLIFTCLALALASCSRRPSTSPAPIAETNSTLTAYQVKGVLQEIRANGWKAVIAHEEIPGYMEAMTMQLDVKNTNELAGLKPGDEIAFRMLVTDRDGWIDQVKKTGASGEVVSQPLILAGSNIEELRPGALLPDCVLTNQLGRQIRLSDFKGSALAFTFIFTRCPFPTYCPWMNMNFSDVQNGLLAANAGTNWQLLSISFDPEYDTPERLGNYSASYKTDARFWSFATGATEDIRKLGNHFSLMFAREGNVFNHNVRTVVVDPAGRVQKLFPGNEWQPAELVEEMKKAMKSNL